MDVLKIIIMVTMAVILCVALTIYLLRKDIFINNFQFHIGTKGMDLNISAKEKGDPPRKDDHLNTKK